MGTKNQPGKFDCFAAADPDEPMFVLLARDRHGPATVRHWCSLRHTEAMVSGVPVNAEKLDEARLCAAAMEAWRDRRTSTSTMNAGALVGPDADRLAVPGPHPGAGCEGRTPVIPDAKVLSGMGREQLLVLLESMR